MSVSGILAELRHLNGFAELKLGEKPSYSHFFVSTIDGECRIGIRLPSFRDIDGRGQSFERAVYAAMEAIKARANEVKSEAAMREILGVE